MMIVHLGWLIFQFTLSLIQGITCPKKKTTLNCNNTETLC